nr:MAG TPA: hypothetical protein [Caudoviricetes sp.]
MTPLVAGEDFSKLPPSMEYILSLRVVVWYEQIYFQNLSSTEWAGQSRVVVQFVLLLRCRRTQ